MPLQAVPSVYPSTFMQSIINTWVKSSNAAILQNRTVKEILWGYTDPFLHSIPLPGVKSFVGVFYPVSETNKGAMPSVIIL